MKPAPLRHSRIETCSTGNGKTNRTPVAVVVCAVVILAALVCGCGEDTTQARKYMNRGDALYQDTMEKASAWQIKVRLISNVSGPAEFKDTVQQSKALADELLKTAKKGRAEFQKIYDLDGVKDYKDYADIRISEFDILGDIVKTMNDTLDQATALIDSGKTSGLPRLYQEATEQIESLTRKGKVLEEEAAELRQEKKL